MDHDQLTRRGYNIAELRRLARRRLPRLVFDFVDGGAEDERTLRASEAAFSDLIFRPQPLGGTTDWPQVVELFGERISQPVIIGPTGLSGLLWPDGEIAAARAAHAADTIYTISHGTTAPIEAIARAAPGPLWFQLFMYRDRGLTQSFAERAQAAGCRAPVLTTDNQVLGQRERDLRNGFSLPPRISLSAGIDMLLRLPFTLRLLRNRHLTFANYLKPGESAAAVELAPYIERMLDPSASWSDVAWLRDLWKGPLIVKGVLHPQEARRAVEVGVDGIVVSNHGGRQLDDTPASLWALPEIVDAVAGRIPVLMDGGIRRGSDIVKALALGATACLIGRPHLWGLTIAGEAGVGLALDIFRREVDRVLALGGWEGLEALDRTIVQSRNPLLDVRAAESPMIREPLRSA